MHEEVVNVIVLNEMLNSCFFGFHRFLQGPETDPATVKKIRDAIDNETEVTVQLINYTKSGMHSSVTLKSIKLIDYVN